MVCVCVRVCRNRTAPAVADTEEKVPVASIEEHVMNEIGNVEEGVEVLEQMLIGLRTQHLCSTIITPQAKQAQHTPM